MTLHAPFPIHSALSRPFHMDWFVLFKLFNRKKREHALIYSCLQNISAFRHDENSEKQTLNSGVGLRLRVPVLPKSVDAYNKQSNLNKSNDHVKSLIVKTWTVETFSGLHFCLTLFATTHFLTFKINCLKTNCSKVYCTFTLMTYIYMRHESDRSKNRDHRSEWKYRSINMIVF